MLVTSSIFLRQNFCLFAQWVSPRFCYVEFALMHTHTHTHTRNKCGHGRRERRRRRRRRRRRKRRGEEEEEKKASSKAVFFPQCVFLFPSFPLSYIQSL